jgi:methyl-accepting chemotaxis protein
MNLTPSTPTASGPLQFLFNLSIGQRLGAAFAMLFVLMTAITAIGVHSIRSFEVDELRSFKTRYAINFRGSVHDRAIALRDVVLHRDQTQAAADLQLIEQLLQAYADSAERLDETMALDPGTSKEERDTLQGIRDVEARALPLSARLLDTDRAGDKEAAQRLLMAEVGPVYVDWLAAINAFIDLQERLARAHNDALQAAAASAVRLTMALLALSLVIGTLVAWRVTRSITNPLESASRVLAGIAQGNLDQTVPAGGRDEVGRLLRSMQHMLDSLRVLVHGVRKSADSVNLAAVEIASGHLDLSSRSEQTAGSLQQAASSLEQITGTVGQTADSARSASQLAVSASQSAQRGGAVVAQVVATMDEINTSSQRIADIIGTIDGIAFQTNILALNAAVEAARAGEQGRGFAVVASEVRNLAGRSAAAAREIKTLISDSVERIDSGTRLAGEAGRSMGEIVTGVQRVSDLVGEISAAAAEQSAGLRQINESVADLDQMTQRNAALVEEGAAATDSLQQQAKTLVQTVARFQLDDQDSSNPPLGMPAADPDSRWDGADRRGPSRARNVTRPTFGLAGQTSPAAVPAPEIPTAADSKRTGTGARWESY